MTPKTHRHFIAVAEALDPRLAAAMARTGPVKIARRDQDLTLAEALCRAVAGQQLSTKAAGTIWERVLASAKAKPLTAHVLKTKPAVLRSCGLSEAKTKAMRAIAEAERAGDLEVSPLRKLDHAERSRRLTTIRGVGPWTADMMGIFYFGDPDVWPDGDLVVRKTLESLTSRRRKTHLTAARFAPHRSYLAVHMWRHADNGLLDS